MSTPSDDSKASDEISQLWSYDTIQQKCSEGLRLFLEKNGFTVDDLDQMNKEGWTPLTFALHTEDAMAAGLFHHGAVGCGDCGKFFRGCSFVFL